MGSAFTAEARSDGSGQHNRSMQCQYEGCGFGTGNPRAMLQHMRQHREPRFFRMLAVDERMQSAILAAVGETTNRMGDGPPIEIKITVELLTGKVLFGIFKPDTTVEQVKQIFTKTEGVPCDQQRWIFKGEQLEDGKTLASYGIPDGASLRLRGGMLHASGRRNFDILQLDDEKSNMHSAPPLEERRVANSPAQESAQARAQVAQPPTQFTISPSTFSHSDTASSSSMTASFGSSFLPQFYPNSSYSNAHNIGHNGASQSGPARPSSEQAPTSRSSTP